VKDKMQVASMAGLVGVMLFAGIAAARLAGQGSGTPVNGDFRNAAVAEVQDTNGRVLLQGTFAPADADNGEVERAATLAPASGDVKGSGEAEVEYAEANPAEQEVEFSAAGLQADSEVVFLIDGHRVGSAKVDGRGRVELELTVRPGA
jgi:hypothetical protein